MSCNPITLNYSDTNLPFSLFSYKYTFFIFFIFFSVCLNFNNGLLPVSLQTGLLLHTILYFAKYVSNGRVTERLDVYNKPLAGVDRMKRRFPPYYFICY